MFERRIPIRGELIVTCASGHERVATKVITEMLERHARLVLDGKVQVEYGDPLLDALWTAWVEAGGAQVSVVLAGPLAGVDRDTQDLIESYLTHQGDKAYLRVPELEEGPDHLKPFLEALGVQNATVTARALQLLPRIATEYRGQLFPLDRGDLDLLALHQYLEAEGHDFERMARLISGMGEQRYAALREFTQACVSHGLSI